MFPCDKLLLLLSLLLLCCWWAIYIITAGRVSHAHAAPFELVKCGAFGQRHLTDARMRELCIEQLTDKERDKETKRERETDRQPATAAAQLCGTVADAPAMWHAARTLNFSWNLNWLRVGHCHSWCHTVPACLPNATQHRQQTTQTSVAGSLCYDAATHTQQPSRTCMPAQSTTHRKETICNTHTHTNENYITSCWNTRLSKYIHKWKCTCIHRKRNASAAYERAASNTYPWPLVVAFYSIYSSCGLFLYSSSALSRFRDIILIL